MRGHRAYLDLPHPVTTRAVKPPLPRGHRKWLDLRPRSKPVHESGKCRPNQRDRP
jgi:hypothetical protein